MELRRHLAGRIEQTEMFYNPLRKHIKNRMLSPVEIERQHKLTNKGF